MTDGKIRAADVKALRERTGAGMMDCKKALVDTNGDMDAAEKKLKELGLAAVAKRRGRATSSGRVFAKIDAGGGAILELSSETDFVSRNDSFVSLGNTVLGDILDGAQRDALDATVADSIAIIKENIEIRRYRTFDVAEREFLIEYIHGEGSVGVIVKVEAEDPADQRVRDLAFDVALHVAAFAPLFLTVDSVDAAYLAEKEELFAKQAEALGKPENIATGIAKGKLKKHLSEVCLMEQPFVKNDKMSMRGVLDELGKEIGSKVTVTDYVYYRAGEQITD